MLTHRKSKIATRHVVAAALLCATAATLLIATQSIARPGKDEPTPIVFANEPEQPSDRLSIARSAERFIKGMANHDADAVWMFASEEDQDAFGTQKEVYSAYEDTFPEFAKAKEVTFTRFWQEGDTPFTQVLLSNRSGGASMATMGFWRDDAGDWKLVSCDVKPVSDLLAGL
jgi:ketosteroid isomerase-like protein